MTLQLGKDESYRCKLCTEVYAKNDAVQHLNETHQVSISDVSLVIGLLEPISFNGKSRPNGFDLRQKVNSKAKGPKAKTDEDPDWTPVGLKKALNYTEENGEFRCNACHRLFKREGQLQRHRCFNAEESERIEYKEPKRRKIDGSNRNNGPKIVRQTQVDLRPVARNVQPKVDCLEEGPFFYRIKKDLRTVSADVFAQTKKIEVQVSVEGDDEEIVRDMFQCLDCQSVLPTLEEAKKHLKGHLPTHHFSCKFCPATKRFTDDSLAEVLRHVKSYHSDRYDSNICVRCGFEAESIRELFQHMSAKHYPGSTHSCSECGEHFGLSILGLVNHVRLKHAAENPTLFESVVIEAKTFYQSEDIFECNLCEKIFFVNSHIEAHKEAHASGSLQVSDDDCCGLFKCTHCKYQADNVDELRLHLSAAHQHLMCRLCSAIIFTGSTFTETLLNHVVSCHDIRYDFDSLVYYEDLFKEAKNLFCVKTSLKCKICPKMFFTRKSFTDHMRSHEGGNVSEFSCEVCEYKCTTRRQLHRHVRSHKFLYYCPDCKLFFTSNQNLQEHLINTHSETEELPCDEYKRSLVMSLFLPEPGFPSTVPLNYVNNDLIMDYYKGRVTNLCGEKFDFPKYAQTSLSKMLVEPVETEKEDEGYESPMEPTEAAKTAPETTVEGTSVSESSTEQPAATDEAQGTTIVLVTREEGTETEQQYEIALPPGTDGVATLREMGYNVEDFSLAEGSSLGNSAGADSKLELSIDSPYVSCENTEFCLAIASQKFCWMTEDALQALMNCFGDMECLFCGKFYGLQSRYYAHQNIHTKATQFKCDECDYYSHSIQLLRHHQDRNHGIENLRCNECEFTTKSKVKLAQHLKKHVPKTELKCPRCSFTCENERRMREHFTLSHPECTAEEISTALGGKRNLNVGSKLRIEPCKQCGKVFESSQMAEHLRSHREENLFRCRECDFTCRSKAYMMTHEQTHQQAKVDVASTEEPKEITNSNQDALSCPMCTAYLKTEKAFTSHIVNVHFEDDTCPQCGHESANRGDFHCHLLIHSEEKSFACNLCPTVLKQEGKMEEHFRTKHPGLRMHYTSFINENPIPIAAIAQMPKQTQLQTGPETTTTTTTGDLSMQAEQYPASQQSDQDSGYKVPSEQSLESQIASSSQASSDVDYQQKIQNDASRLTTDEGVRNEDTQTNQEFRQDSGGVSGLTGSEMPVGPSSDLPVEQMMITEDQINAALQALVEAGEQLPEGAEIMVEDNTLYVDGVPRVVIAPADESEIEEHLDQGQINQPQDSMNVNDTVNQAPADHVEKMPTSGNAMLDPVVAFDQQFIMDTNANNSNAAGQYETQATLSVQKPEGSAAVGSFDENLAIPTDATTSVSESIRQQNSDTQVQNTANSEEDFLNVPGFAAPGSGEQRLEQRSNVITAEDVMTPSEMPVSITNTEAYIEKPVSQVIEESSQSDQVSSIGEQPHQPNENIELPEPDQILMGVQNLDHDSQEPHLQVPNVEEPDLVQNSGQELVDQQQPIGEEEQYIDLSNLDLSNVDLPPGNYNLVIDEQGQAVFVETDVIDENTIQIVAQ